jgi:hypothetical protein
MRRDAASLRDTAAGFEKLRESHDSSAVLRHGPELETGAFPIAAAGGGLSR